MPEERPTVFISPDYRYVCDTCEPLKKGIADGTIEWIGFKRGLYPGMNFESKELPGLRLAAYWDAKKAQNWGLNFHRNEGIEIGFVESGSAEFSTDRKGLKFEKLSSDTLTITKPWQEHKVGNPHLTASKMYFLILDVGIRRPNQEWKWPEWVILERKDRDELTHFMQNASKCVFKSTRKIKNLFSSLGELLPNPDGNITRISLIINSILLEILEFFRSSRVDFLECSPNENVVRCFLDQLPNYCAKPWTLESMAEDCGLKPTRFIHYCRQLANKTPMDILAEARLTKAKELLSDADSGRSITEIAFDCGFASSQYFSQKFRSEFGLSPREFKSALKAQ